MVTNKTRSLSPSLRLYYPLSSQGSSSCQKSATSTGAETSGSRRGKWAVAQRRCCSFRLALFPLACLFRSRRDVIEARGVTSYQDALLCACVWQTGAGIRSLFAPPRLCAGLSDSRMGFNKFTCPYSVHTLFYASDWQLSSTMTPWWIMMAGCVSQHPARLQMESSVSLSLSIGVNSDS